MDYTTVITWITRINIIMVWSSSLIGIIIACFGFWSLVKQKISCALIVTVFGLALAVLSLGNVVTINSCSDTYSYVESFNVDSSGSIFFTHGKQKERICLDTFDTVICNYEKSEKDYAYLEIEYNKYLFGIINSKGGIVTSFTFYEKDRNYDTSDDIPSSYNYLKSEYDYLSYLVNKECRLSEEDFNRVEDYNSMIKCFQDLKPISLDIE